MRRTSTLITTLLLLAACDSGDREVTLRFSPRVGELPFACGENFSGLGTSDASATPLDFRMYVHDVALVRSSGEKVAVAVTDDASWQHEGLVLLDFEDGSGACMTGSPGMNFAVKGTVPDTGDYVGVEFTVGVPEAMNHLDGATAPAPLNAQGLWWSWAGGYKYVRLDFRPETQPEFFYHLGATACAGSVGEGFTCQYANLAKISLEEFDVDADEIVVDAAKIVGDVDVAKVPDGMPDSLPGCMAFPGDPECPAMMAPLGLGFETNTPAGPQSLFAVAAGGAS